MPRVRMRIHYIMVVHTQRFSTDLFFFLGVFGSFFLRTGGVEASDFPKLFEAWGNRFDRVSVAWLMLGVELERYWVWKRLSSMFSSSSDTAMVPQYLSPAEVQKSINLEH